MGKFFRGASFYILIFIILLVLVHQFANDPQQTVEIEFSTLYKELVSGNVEEINIINRSVEGIMAKNDEDVLFTSYIPTVFSTERFTIIVEEQMAKQADFKLIGTPPPTTPWFIDLLPSIFMILIFIVFWFVFMQQSQGGGNRVMSFGKSRAKLHKGENKNQITFDDVAGLDEEKAELEELVDFLRNPRKYMELGARIPKGILMVGPPGTGKTYLTKAVAGEAGVPFFSISGSDFVEMFVGVGASRVRDLFEQAKKNSPAIIFIDEIDAVGRRRGAGLGGGHDEREQTLNQLLVEMDGFGANEGIIIVAATNRPDILDPALLRPGRFDRQVMVGVPDIKGREAILKVHSKGKPLARDVDIKVLARRTPGFTPADIENLMNEAALLTARKNEQEIKMETIEEAITKVIAGVEKRSRVISEKERKLTAYHEAGHAIVATLMPDSDPVHQITIIPRGRAGGFTMILPEEDKYYATKTEMEDHIVHLLGGRVAEKLVLGDISTGAQNDIQRVSDIARSMVTKYGMSDKIGPMALGNGDEEVFLGRDIASRPGLSEKMAAEVDGEVRGIVEAGYKRTTQLISDNLDKLHAVAKALLKLETLDADQYLRVFNGEITIKDEDDVDDLVAKLKELKDRDEAEEKAKRKAEREKAEAEKDESPKSEAKDENQVEDLDDEKVDNDLDNK